MIFNKKDELLGGWYSHQNDDDAQTSSGLGLEFLEENKGLYQTWANQAFIVDDKDEQNEAATETETPFEWQRVDEKTIKIKFLDADNWDTINYKITLHTGEYDILLQQLTAQESESFWCSSEPLSKATVNAISTKQKIALFIIVLVVIIALSMIKK